MGAPTKTKDKRHNKHLTPAQRTKIESCLNMGMSFNEIGKIMNKPASTISREVKRNSIVLPAKENDCVKRGRCEIRNLCDVPRCLLRCSRKCGDHCYDLCSEYAPAVCEKLQNPPHVCNGCMKSGRCKVERRLYRANDAQEAYSTQLKALRSGFDLTEAELAAIDQTVTPLINKGQAPYHILQAHPELEISVMTLYRIIESGLIGARNIDLKQQVKRKPRKRPRRKLHNEEQFLNVNKAGRMWEDFKAYMEEHDVAHVEMDCVEGKQGEAPALLTLHFPDLKMQIASYLERHDSKNVVAALDHIESCLGTDLFREAFPVILTDNGSEFTDIEGMERSCIDPQRKRTKIFFCEPNRSDQKGACENNHKLIRDVIPKGTSLIPFIQADITLMMNHINSYRRKKSHGLCAYDLAMQAFPAEFFDHLGLYRIPDDQVMLKPKLLRERIRERTEAFDYSPI